ncbi:MAG: methionine synthase [Anaerolineales bacterium]|nr:methionine synthase [Anaerolineales bacterium]
MPREYTNRRYLDALQERVLVYDGAMGTSLQSLRLTEEHFGGRQYYGCNDYLVISYPQAVEEVHRSFLEAGVDVIETDTFRANRLTLGEYGLGERVVEINHAAAHLARRLADEYSLRPSMPGGDPSPRFVAGSIGPSGKLPSADDPELSNVTFEALVDIFSEQATGLVKGGADVILIETSQDILEVKAAIIGVQRAFAALGSYLPLQAQVTLDTTGRMLLGTDIAAALAILEGMPIDVIGLNCSTGPEHMRAPIDYLGENASLPVSCIPNAGLPLNVDGEAVYPLEPEPFAEALLEFVEKNGVAVVGGCCGTTPQHLRLLVEKLHGRRRPDRPVLRQPRLASMTRAIPLRQEPPPLLVGERCNAQGSRKFKRLLLAGDEDAILELAREQVERGAHALDISVAVTERGDEGELMRRVVKKLSAGVEVPLMIDSTEPEVMEIALQTAPGRCVLNSTHLEGGRQRADRVFALAKQYNAAVLCLTIDEQGMAKTAVRKLEVARRLLQIATQDHDLPPEALIYDALTFTLATGDPEFANSAIETLDGIRRIKSELPGVLTSLGVSNVSFGLSPAARAAVNSIMLFHAVQAGLDMAIVNPAHITPYADIPAEQRQLADDLIFNRRPDALQRLIEGFDSVASSLVKQGQGGAKTALEGMTPQERLHWRILHRHKDGVEADIDTLILSRNGGSAHSRAVSVLNTVLLPAMKEVGDKFGAGELILPFVLQSAEVMKKAVSHLENYLEKKEGASKGKVVLATVYGDVHDIGKNLVKTILANNGYQVLDLGKQVPAETIITQAVESGADAIGLSALLVSTSKQMPLVINELHRRGAHIPVLVGGAAINRRFGWRILFTEQETPYTAGVFYCKDAFEGLAVMDALTDPGRHAELVQKVRSEAEREMGRAVATAAQEGSGKRSAILPAPPGKLPDAFGPRVVSAMPLEMVFKHLAKNELFRLSWGAKNAHGEEWARLQVEFEERLLKMTRQALRSGWFSPQGAYGYWPAQSEGDDLLLYDPAAIGQGTSPVLIARFTFPRQPDRERLCLADYYAPVASGVFDLAIFQVVTVGSQATERFDRLQEAGDYSEAYYFHGLAVQTAEAAAEYLYQHIRRELSLPAGQGKRYSWGYPAIPNLADHRKVFDLLPAEEALGMSLTPAYQLVPEQSTAAIVVHHPQAKYFSVGESRVEQLVNARGF